MKIPSLRSHAATRVVLSVLALSGLAFSAVSAAAAEYPAPREGDFVARDFRFHTGEVMPELRLHYTTVGAASGEPVLILHGTAGSRAGMLTPGFAGGVFGPRPPPDGGKDFFFPPAPLR